MERERRKKGTRTHQLHVPVEIDSAVRLKAEARRRGVGIGVILDELTRNLPGPSEHSGTANLRNTNGLS